MTAALMHCTHRLVETDGTRSEGMSEWRHICSTSEEDVARKDEEGER